MIRASLGPGGLTASRICLGCRDFGSRVDEESAHRLLDAADHLGIDFLDLADVYPVPPLPTTWGLSEEIVGRWLKGRRDRFVVATKFGSRVGSGVDDAGTDRLHVLKACEGSLRRLQTDRIDLYFVHHPDPQTPIDETLSALEQLVDAGKVRYVGLSNFDATSLAAAVAAASPRMRRRIAAVQVRYSLLHRAPEISLVPLCDELGLALLPWNPLATGMLAGKYQRSVAPPRGSRFAEGNYGSRYQAYYWSDRCFDFVESLQRLAREQGCSPAQLALAWILGRDTVAAAIIGASTPSQLEETAGAVARQVSEVTRRRLDHLSEWSLQPA